jgi:hypothetical protein
VERGTSYNARVWPLAACALVLLPGIVLVRAPWRFVPLLSVSFWIVSFTPVFAETRTRWLGQVLVTVGALSLLRLLRPDLSRPSWSSVTVCTGAFVPIVALWPLALPPGTVLPFEATVAQLLTWRDGTPVSYEPLLPLPHFVPAGTGLASLAADLGLMAGMEAARAVFAIALAGEALLVLAFYALLVTRVPPPAAAALSLVTPALAHAVAALPVPGSSHLALALALVSGAGACFWNGGTRSSAVAGALMVLAALRTDPHMGLLALPLLAVALATSSLDGAARSRKDRACTALVAALLLGGPVLLDTARVMAGLAADSSGWLAGAASIVTALTAAAAGRLLQAIRADGADRPAPEVPRREAAILALALALAAASGWQQRARAQAEPLASPDDLRVLSWLAGQERRHDVVCQEGVTAAIWAPAMGLIPLRDPVLPSYVAVEVGARRPWPCTLLYARRGRPPSARGALVFASGNVHLISLDAVSHRFTAPAGTSPGEARRSR